MQVEFISFPDDRDWLKVRNNALFTQRKSTEKPPTSLMKTRLLASEHSPIYDLWYTWQFIDLPYWIAMHLRTHHIECHHYISTQRNDIYGAYDRRKAPQDSLVNHRISANAMEIMTISRKRLCTNASLETRQTWQMFLDVLKDVTPELYNLCVKPCVYRSGICSEYKQCGFNKTKKFQEELQKYLQNFKNIE
jgi:hypothetical protein